MLQHPPHNMQIKETCVGFGLNLNDFQKALMKAVCLWSWTSAPALITADRTDEYSFSLLMHSDLLATKINIHPVREASTKKQNIWFFLLTFCMSDFIFQMLSSSKKNKQKIGCYYFCISSQSTLLWVQVNITCLHRDMYTEHTVQISNPSV